MILLVDDNAGLREALIDFLSPRGYAVECAANGDEALPLVASVKSRPALIFLNLIMPVLDGWGFLAQLRNEHQLTGIPVVIMSGCRDVARQAKQAGAVAVVRKPVEPKMLLRIIEHFRARV